jgi:hypothetical protein
MPAIDPKSLPANMQPGAPARNLTPQEMQMALAQMKASRVEERPPADFVEEVPPQMPMIPNRRFNPSGRSNISRQYAKGGSVSSASKRADGCATKGHTKGKMV